MSMYVYDWFYIAELVLAVQCTCIIIYKYMNTHTTLFVHVDEYSYSSIHRFEA